MWTIKELKYKAKIAFKRNYWKCVLASFVLSLLTALSAGTPSSGITYEEGFRIENEDGSYTETAIVKDFAEEIIDNPAITIILAVVVIISLAVSLALNIFITNPVKIGGCRYFTENTYMESNVGQVFSAFRKNTYMNNVSTMFFMNLYIFLWSLLLFIPGIIKSYEYRMIPYLLADDPNMPKDVAFRISKEMMDGQKMNAFLLDLSFIGWIFVILISCGIAGFFYVTPYIHAANAELFVTLRHNYFNRKNFVN